MNSALKPVLTSSGPQNPSVTSQLNKPMHPQSTPSTYGQPSTHMPQSLVNLPHGNPNVAHNHPNPAHQTNHYSPLNVPNAPQHYSTNSPSTIPASNHPVPNVSQAAAGGQTYTPPKNVPYAGGYQPNLGHPPNQNPIPPVSQTLPATQPQPPTHPPASSEPSEKPQSNGTPETKSPTKPELQENHVAPPKEKTPVPPTPPQSTTDKSEDKTPPPSTATTEQKQKPEPVKVAEETPASLPTSVEKTVPSIASNASATSAPDSTGATAVSDTKNETKSEEVEGGETSRETNEATPAVETAETTTKSKEKEQKTTPVQKAATVPRTPTRKSKTPKSDGESPKSSKSDAKPVSTQKSPSAMGKSKRMRIRTQPYQSPLPEIEIITKISTSTPKTKHNDDKLIVFYKNEFLAVRNSEGGFYICQAVQNIYRTSPKIRIRWLSQDKNEKSGEVYTPDFYDNTDFDCILTNLNLERVDKGKYRLPPAEHERTDSILKRSLAVEKGEVTSPSLTEEHPDGIDLSLYKEESQLKKRKGTKRKSSALRSGGKSVATTSKSPDQAKVRKVAAKTPKKSAPKRPPPKKVTAPVVEPLKRATASSRMDRAKRRSDNQNHNKVSPVVDAKKAKVLAKVARKTAVASSNLNRNQPAAKNMKVPKVIASSSKVQKPPQKAAVTRKTKRSSRK